MKWKTILFACLYAYFGRDGARGQNTQPLSTPNAQCAIAFQFTAAANSRVLDNRGAACLNFTLTASVPSTVSALSLVVQTAQDNGSTLCSTCTWATYTPSTGSNPLTSATGGNATFVTAAGAHFAQYLRVQLTSVTSTGGTISGQLQGFLTGAPISVTISGGGGCPGTSGTPCQVDLYQVAGSATVTGGIPGTLAVGGAAGTGSALHLVNNPVLFGGSDTNGGGTGNVRDITTDPSGNLQVAVIGDSAVLNNQQAVTATAVALATNAAKNACVKALLGNTINIYLGNSGVTDATGMELAPGEAVCLPVSNTNLLYVIASTTGASVSWIGTH